MRAREGAFLLAGAVLGAAAVLAVLDRGPVVEAGGPPPRVAPVVSPVRAPVPADAPAPPVQYPAAAPVPAVDPGSSTEESERKAAGELALETLKLQLAINRLDSGPRGGAKAGAAPGYAGNPYALMARESLEGEREKAARIVEPLLEKWRKALPGEDRAAAMKELAGPMLRLLEAGGPMEHLVALEEAAERGETAAERRWALIATHTLWQQPVVDFQLARVRSPHVEVRYFAVEGLAWVRGEEMARAIEGVLLGLEDPEPRVRAMAATSLAVIVADPGRAEAILSRLERETDPGAAQAMAVAVRTLDPEGGRARAARALGSVSAEVRAAVETALARAK